MRSKQTAREKILSTVTECGRCTTRDLAEKCDLNQSYARVAANAMVADGEIGIEEKTNGHVYVPHIDEAIE